MRGASGVQGQGRSHILHSDKINLPLKGGKSRQRSSFCSKAYPGPQRSKGSFSALRLSP